jgi:2-iminobutanoate/2-iminopropanoate deaminase
MKKIVNTDKAPAAIGPYSQAVDAGSLVFVAGQVPVSPSEGRITEQTVAGQTRQSIENIKAILAAAGLGLDHVLKTTVFLVSMDDFREMNEVYAEYFRESPPARATIAVSGLPLGARVEIEAVAGRTGRASEDTVPGTRTRPV